MNKNRNNKRSLQSMMSVMGFLVAGLLLVGATVTHSAPMSTYPLKATPVEADQVLIVDSQDANRTKRAALGDLPGTGGTDLTAGANIDITTGVISVTGLALSNISDAGAAAALGATNGTIGHVITWVDGGSCSDPQYTTEATCIGTWTPLASAPIDAASGAITDSGNLITATTIEGALAENRTAIDLNTAKVTNTDNQTATQVPVTATGFTGNLSGTDTNVQTALATIDAMTVSGSDTLGDLSCTTDQVAKWNGTAWACAADATAAGAGYVSTPPTYSDSACTAGQYAFSTTTGYVCVASGDWNTFALTNWSAPTPDTTPDAFSFTNQTDVEVSTTITSARVQITGINTDTEVSATGGTAAICTSAAIEDCGTFGAAPGDVTNNQYVAARHTSSASASTAVDTVVTVGTMERTFRSTTAAGASSGYIGSDGTVAAANSGGGAGGRCMKYTTTTAGEITQLTLAVGSWTTLDTLYAGLYSHNSTDDFPDDQLAYGSVAATTNQKNTVSMNAGYTLVDSTVYWLCFKAQNDSTTGELYFASEAATGGRHVRFTEAMSTLNNLPSNGNTGYGGASTDIAISYGDKP